LEVCLQDGHEAQGSFRICHGVGRSGFDRHSGHGNLFLALADQILDVGHLLAKLSKGHVLETEVV
jgi:hypothetical protein